jgi:hypothetical protein
MSVPIAASLERGKRLVQPRTGNVKDDFDGEITIQTGLRA